MTASDKERRTAAEPEGEQPSKQESRSEEIRADRPEGLPSSLGEKASTAPSEEIQGCAPDTIRDGDGNYLEPPD